MELEDSGRGQAQLAGLHGEREEVEMGAARTSGLHDAHREDVGKGLPRGWRHGLGSRWLVLLAVQPRTRCP